MAKIKTSITITAEHMKMLDDIAKVPGPFFDRSRSWLIEYALNQVFTPLLEVQEEEEEEVN